MKRELIVLILLSFCFNSCKKETGIIKLGDLEGVVRNEFQQPIEGVKVEIEDAEYTTSFDGKYIFKKLPEKEYTISATKQSYLTNIQIITVVADSKIILAFIMSSGEKFLNISKTTFNVNYNIGAIDLSVSSNADWVIENKSSWIECDIQGGQGNKNITIKYSSNNGDLGRNDSLVFISGSIRTKLMIHQSASAKIIKFEGRIGNEVNGTKDSVYLIFNRPVVIQNIKSSWNYCISDIKYNQPNINCSVSFSYPCAELGGKYPFSS